MFLSDYLLRDQFQEMHMDKTFNNTHTFLNARSLFQTVDALSNGSFKLQILGLFGFTFEIDEHYCLDDKHSEEVPCIFTNFLLSNEMMI